MDYPIQNEKFMFAIGQNGPIFSVAEILSILLSGIGQKDKLNAVSLALSPSAPTC